MCGIAGWIARRDIGLADSTAQAMIDVMRHRGPDGDGLYHADARSGWRVGFGHLRLAIIDLAGGAQPMLAEDGTSVTFNGEIYNYRELKQELQAAGVTFRTNSDTEILLEGYRHWGDRFVERLAGMFAFALWDPIRERLLVVRDRFGKKPVFLHRRDGLVAFASEIKALLELPGVERRLDHEALGLYFAFRYVPGPRTLFRDIVKLGPGQMLVWEGGRDTVTTWYKPPDTVPAQGTARGDPLPEFERLLDQAVTRRLVADVPLGAFLSGGLDSSTVVALMARRTGRPVSTYSIGFAEARYSELPHANLVARQLGCDHHPVLFSTGELIDGLVDATRYRDAPVSEPADLPILLLSRMAVTTLKVVLTGEGSDEILAGYPKHAYDRYASLYQAIVPGGAHDLIVEPVLRALPYGFRRIKTAAASLGERDFTERMIRWFGALSAKEQAELSTVARPRYDIPYDDPANGALRRILAFDQTVWLPDNLLERGDRMTMGASLESRMPFLDHDLAAFASTLPDSWRLHGLTGKWILRRVAEKILPRSIIERPKSGFRMPVNEWFRNEMRPFLTDMLGPGAATRPFYRPGRLDAALDEHLSGRQNHEKLVWQMLMLELFQREYRLAA
ncbi:MAG: asparagine synthase (glutamine-hydrolyzing) [Alphaproteobacteria bacterium]|nr:asparagine synthase (glutamine-hydrolyzing) [Alphaproteobacteria bacterium]